MTRHDYLSTACLHEAEAFAAGDPERAAELHAYCAGKTGAVGAKAPARCKFCESGCSCVQHRCDCGHEGLDEMFHLYPCSVAARRHERRRPRHPDLDAAAGIAAATRASLFTHPDKRKPRSE